MEYLILRPTVAGGRPVDAGETVPLSEDEAAVLLRLGKATVAVPPVPPSDARPDSDGTDEVPPELPPPEVAPEAAPSGTATAPARRRTR